MSDKIKTGNKGEQLAAEFLLEKGFKIVARNYRFRRAEIDLIAQREDWLIFVEVKTRTSAAYGEPEEFVSSAQVNRIFDAAEDYIFAVNWQGHIRFDIVSVKMEPEPLLEHFEDAIN